MLNDLDTYSCLIGPLSIFAVKRHGGLGLVACVIVECLARQEWRPIEVETDTGLRVARVLHAMEPNGVWNA